MTAFVSVPADKALLLKLVLPNLDFVADGDEVFCFEGSKREGSRLTLVQSRSGYAALTPAGLANLLQEIGAFTPHKAQLLSKMENIEPRDLMIIASRMIVLGHSARPQEPTDEILMKIVKLPPMERFTRAREIGYEKVMKIALRVLDRRYNPTTNASLRVKQRNFYADLTEMFKKDKFQTWSLTGDPEVDTVNLLSFF